MIEIFKDKKGEWRWRLRSDGVVLLRGRWGHARMYDARKDAAYVHRHLGIALKQPAEKV